MIIGGIQKFSLVDYPGKISAVIFLSGCNFRCGFCHNPELVDPELIKHHPSISEREVLDFLAERRGKLDGVCITGGEPSIWQDLPDFIVRLKEMGFLIKLDTNATHPAMVEKTMPLVDYFAIDIKNWPGKYAATTGVNVDVENIAKSLKAIAARGIFLELRTTVVPGLITRKDVESIKDWLLDLSVAGKVGLYAIQQFRTGKNLKSEFRNIKPYRGEDLESLAEILKPFVKKVEVRGI